MKDETIKLGVVLTLMRNKHNRQYTLTIKKKIMVSHGLTPEDILNTPIIIKEVKQNAKKKINNIRIK